MESNWKLKTQEQVNKLKGYFTGRSKPLNSAEQKISHRARDNDAYKAHKSEYVNMKLMFMSMIILVVIWAFIHQWIMNSLMGASPTMVIVMYGLLGGAGAYVAESIAEYMWLEWKVRTTVVKEDGLSKIERKILSNRYLYILPILAAFAVAWSIGVWAFMRYLILGRPYGGVLLWGSEIASVSVYIIIGILTAFATIRVMDKGIKSDQKKYAL